MKSAIKGERVLYESKAMAVKMGGSKISRPGI
jgi:hypothetical protein